MRRVDVVLAATPNLTSSGLIRRCSTATIEIGGAAAGTSFLRLSRGYTAVRGGTYIRYTLKSN